MLRSPTSPVTIRTSAPRAPDLLGGLVGRTGQVVEDDPGALVGEGQRLGAAETGAGAGDDGDLAFETHSSLAASTSEIAVFGHDATARRTASRSSGPMSSFFTTR